MSMVFLRPEWTVNFADNVTLVFLAIIFILNYHFQREIHLYITYMKIMDAKLTAVF